MSQVEPPPLISVILVCYNSSRWLPRCIQSLRAQTLFGQSEIILVDNASSDNSEELARQLTVGWPNVQIIQTGRNLGFSANNKGAEIAQGKYLYLLNPDTWLEPDCLEAFYKGVERGGAQGAGGIMLEYEDQSLQAKGSSGFDIFGNPVSPPRNRDPNPLFCIAGFYFINRQFFLELGMLDERFFMYGEEMDLSWRIWLSGGRIIYVPNAKCHHRGAVAVNPEGGTKIVENRTSPQKRFLANRNFLLVIAKNCQHLLLVMLATCAGLMLAEGMVTLVITRKWHVARQTCFQPLLELWRLRTHVCQERRRIRALRRHGDFWMLRFLRLGFGRWGEVSKILRVGFPTFGR